MVLRGYESYMEGVFYSGGSHMCYQSTPLALTQCSKCTDSSGFGPQLPDFTCSIDTFNNGTAPACDYCQSDNYVTPFLPIICLMTLLGCFVLFKRGGRSNPPVTSMCGSPRLSLSADVHSAGDVIAFEGCPVNVTEVHYLSHPEDYPKHPPCFLAQSSKSDMNADLCAAKSYYDTLVVRVLCCACTAVLCMLCACVLHAAGPYS